MYTLNYTSAIKKMTIHELGDFIFENYYKQIGYVKESGCYSMKRLKRKDLLLLATKLIGKIAYSSNVKEYYNSYLKNKNTNLVKRSKTITQQPKAIANPSIANIKPVIAEHP